MTFYAPDLSPFVRGLRGGGVPIFAASYAHAETVSKESGATTTVMGTVYSASVVVPGTGHLLEARSAHRTQLSLARARWSTVVACI